MDGIAGEHDTAAVAALFADRARSRILQALTDGRALPASVLASEAGVAASTASEHLARLVDGGMLDVERSGRHRYYRLASERVAVALEALAVLAPARPIRSLRESTRAAAVRRGRTCYDHLAGALGVAVTEGFIARRALVRTDGRRGTVRRGSDGLARQLQEHPYRLGPRAAETFGALGVDLDELSDQRRQVLRFCVDWSEQRHHLSGALGAAVCDRMLDQGWLRRVPTPRAVQVTDTGREVLTEVLGIRTGFG